MLIAIGLGTFALIRALRLALNKDHIAIEMVPRRRPQRRLYEQVHHSAEEAGIEEAGIEDAME